MGKIRGPQAKNATRKPAKSNSGPKGQFSLLFGASKTSVQALKLVGYIRRQYHNVWTS